MQTETANGTSTSNRNIVLPGYIYDLLAATARDTPRYKMPHLAVRGTNAGCVAYATNGKLAARFQVEDIGHGLPGEQRLLSLPTTPKPRPTSSMLPATLWHGNATGLTVDTGKGRIVADLHDGAFPPIDDVIPPWQPHQPETATNVIGLSVENLEILTKLCKGMGKRHPDDGSATEGCRWQWSGWNKPFRLDKWTSTAWLTVVVMPYQLEELGR